VGEGVKVNNGPLFSDILLWFLLERKQKEKKEFRDFLFPEQRGESVKIIQFSDG
jgi:hypothetical protein